MKYGILGTGDVAQVIANKLLELGHEVMMGARSASNEKADSWKNENGDRAFCGTFEDAAKFGERIFNCVQGVHTFEALKAAKYSGVTCLGEEVQKLLPETKVVKTLNYIGSVMMTNTQELREPVTGFYCGNDAKAKQAVEMILRDFGLDTI